MVPSAIPPHPAAAPPPSPARGEGSCRFPFAAILKTSISLPMCDSFPNNDLPSQCTGGISCRVPAKSYRKFRERLEISTPARTSAAGPVSVGGVTLRPVCRRDGVRLRGLGSPTARRKTDPRGEIWSCHLGGNRKHLLHWVVRTQHDGLKPAKGPDLACRSKRGGFNGKEVVL